MRRTHEIRSSLSVGSLALLIIVMLTITQCKDSMSGITGSDSDHNNLPTSTTAIHGKTTLPGGALYEISVPENDWKDLVIYAHGYVNPGTSLTVPVDSVFDDFGNVYFVDDIITNMGFAYAATSYRDNGLVIPDAIKDIIFLRKRFIQEYGEPDHVYLVGPSEGGAVTTLAIENYPKLFDAGFASCGPIGDFREQLNHLGDFHVLFNYFFPNIDIGDPSGVSNEVINAWYSKTLQAAITNAVLTNPLTTAKLLTVAQIPVDQGDPNSIVKAILELIRYNVIATNDAIQKLGGKPFDNIGRVYAGTGSYEEDWLLNQQVERYSADPKALRTIEKEYQTTGVLEKPLVTMHTTFDHIIPFWHELKYQNKVLSSGSSPYYTTLPILGRYGHCNFTVNEVLAGFSIMVYQATSEDLQIPSSLVAKGTEQQLLKLSRTYGANPKVIQKQEFIQ